jgi:hypothetical protein
MQAAVLSSSKMTISPASRSRRAWQRDNLVKRRSRLHRVVDRVDGGKRSDWQGEDARLQQHSTSCGLLC